MLRCSYLMDNERVMLRQRQRLATQAHGPAMMTDGSASVAACQADPCLVFVSELLSGNTLCDSSSKQPHDLKNWTQFCLVSMGMGLKSCGRSKQAEPSQVELGLDQSRD